MQLSTNVERTWYTEASTDFCRITEHSIRTFWKMLKANTECKAKYTQALKNIQIMTEASIRLWKSVNGFHTQWSLHCEWSV